ncbi:MAG: hypothetical protein IJP03_04460 [Christensenellaceae bacterium]|nr:hypothetical protein [Christensenellaceae bacterium]
MEQTQNTTLKRKGRFGFVLAMLLVILLLIASAFLLWTSIAGKGTGESPEVFGWSLYAARAEDGSVPHGAAVLVDRTAAEFESGTAVVYRDPTRPEGAQMRMAFAGQKDADGNLTVFDQRGENAVLVPPANVRGQATKTISGVGSVLAMIQGDYGLYITGGLCLLLLIMLVGLPIGRHRKYKSANNDVLLYDDQPAEYPAAEETWQEEQPSREDFESPVALEQKAAPTPQEHKELPAFGLQIDERYSKKQPPQPVTITGSLRGDLAQMRFTGNDRELEMLSGLIDTAVKKRGSDTVTMDLIYGEKTALEVQCSWADVGLISTIVVEIQKRLEQKEKEK